VNYITLTFGDLMWTISYPTLLLVLHASNVVAYSIY